VANTPYHKNIKCHEIEQTDRDLDCLNGYSKTKMIPVGIDKGSLHTKQIIAELTEPGGRTIHCQILELSNSIWTREEKPKQ
jgi:activator of 2-hydroxyglutaryl-CoA dehydratase